MKYMYYWTKYPERIVGMLEDVKREREISDISCGRHVANLYHFELVMLMALFDLAEMEQRDPKYKEKFKSNKSWFGSFYYKRNGYYRRNRVSVVDDFIQSFGNEKIDDFIAGVMDGYDAVSGKGLDVELDYEDVWR